MGQIRIGTSGWSYAHWRDVFYPDDVPRADWLDYYAKRLASVEINASFYQLPKESTLSDWARRVPRDFLFAFKASRYLTHMKKLKPAAESRKRMFECTRGLGAHLGPILFQLPPKWRANPVRLDEFIAALPRRRRYAFEFRDDSWWSDEVFDILKRHGAATVWFDLEGRRSPLADTADFRYVRWHGPGEQAYTGHYGRNRLWPLARRVREWRESGQDLFVYFDNDEAGYAAADALALREMLDERTSAQSR